MKILKLIILFAAVVGIMSAIFFVPWDNLFDDKPISEVEQQHNFDKIHNEIVDGWAASDGWNKELYDKMNKKILSYETSHLITTKDAVTLRTTLKEHSINKVCSTYETLLSKLNRISGDSKLCQNYEGLMYIKKDQKLTADTRVDNIASTHGLYYKAKCFVVSPHYSNPNFDYNSSPMWISLSVYQSAANSEVNNIKRNSLYAKINHIEDFKTGLNSEHINKLFTAAKSSYYSKLKKQIKSYFQNIYDNRSVPADNAELLRFATYIKKLQTAISTYKKEYGSDSELMQLKNKFDDYINEYKNE